MDIPLKPILFWKFSAVTGRLFLRMCFQKYMVLFCCPQKRNTFLWVVQAKYIFGHLFHTQQQLSLHCLKKRLGGNTGDMPVTGKVLLLFQCLFQFGQINLWKITVYMLRLLACSTFTAWFSEVPVCTYFRMGVSRILTVIQLPAWSGQSWIWSWAREPTARKPWHTSSQGYNWRLAR